jgi:hypothetical protein
MPAAGSLKQEGGRGQVSASISPAASIAESERSAGAGPIRMLGGRSSFSFSVRPGCSTPPVTHSTASAPTPWSCANMARTHTAAVTWYSGTPTRRPAKSSGRVTGPPDRT